MYTFFFDDKNNKELLVCYSRILLEQPAGTFFKLIEDASDTTNGYYEAIEEWSYEIPQIELLDIKNDFIIEMESLLLSLSEQKENIGKYTIEFFNNKFHIRFSGNKTRKYYNFPKTFEDIIFTVTINDLMEQTFFKIYDSIKIIETYSLFYAQENIDIIQAFNIIHKLYETEKIFQGFLSEYIKKKGFYYEEVSLMIPKSFRDCFFGSFDALGESLQVSSTSYLNVDSNWEHILVQAGNSNQPNSFSINIFKKYFDNICSFRMTTTETEELSTSIKNIYKNVCFSNQCNLEDDYVNGYINTVSEYFWNIQCIFLDASEKDTGEPYKLINYLTSLLFFAPTNYLPIISMFSHKEIPLTQYCSYIYERMVENELKDFTYIDFYSLVTQGIQNAVNDYFNANFTPYLFDSISEFRTVLEVIYKKSNIKYKKCHECKKLFLMTFNSEKYCNSCKEKLKQSKQYYKPRYLENGELKTYINKKHNECYKSIGLQLERLIETIINSKSSINISKYYVIIARCYTLAFYEENSSKIKEIWNIFEPLDIAKEKIKHFFIYKLSDGMRFPYLDIENEEITYRNDEPEWAEIWDKIFRYKSIQNDKSRIDGVNIEDLEVETNAFVKLIVVTKHLLSQKEYINDAAFDKCLLGFYEAYSTWMQNATQLNEFEQER